MVGQATAKWVENYTEGLTFTLLLDNTYEVSIGTATSVTDILIPSVYNDLAVKRIAASAFAGCASLTTIVLPELTTSIMANAFEGCTSLASIIIPESVTYVGSSAFLDCTVLTIYAEAESKPALWNANWNIDGLTVVWGYVAQ